MERVLTHIVPCAVSKSDSDHGSGYYGYRTLGLAPAGIICHSTCSLGHYPIRRDTFANPPPETPMLNVFLTPLKR